MTLAIAGQKYRGSFLRRAARALLVALACGTGAFRLATDALAAGPSDKLASHTVTIEGVAYQPAALIVKRGDTVVWVNNDPFPHTVTASGAFDSHAISAGASWKYVARKPGIFPYICTLHPNMKGTLTVR